MHFGQRSATPIRFPDYAIRNGFILATMTRPTFFANTQKSELSLLNGSIGVKQRSPANATGLRQN